MRIIIEVKESATLARIEQFSEISAEKYPDVIKLISLEKEK